MRRNDRYRGGYDNQFNKKDNEMNDFPMNPSSRDGYNNTYRNSNRHYSRGRSNNYNRSMDHNKDINPDDAMVRRDLPRKPIQIIHIGNEDASFILGAGGRTKRKLSRVSGADLNIRDHEGTTVLEVSGSEEAMERAILYVDYVMQQRVGNVQLNCDPLTRTDLTCMKVPPECVGYVTGRKGQGLRSIEEEWGTLMFFIDLKSNHSRSTENLAIFGTNSRNRKGAELKVMSSIEQKVPGYYTSDFKEFISDEEGEETDIIPIAQEDYSYALGREGSTRRKIATAAGAIIEYVGYFACIYGKKEERTRGREYLSWLCAQRVRYVHVPLENRNDVAVVQVPTSCVAFVTGSKGSSLRKFEESSATFIFLDGSSRGTENEKLLIFGASSDGRRRAKEMVLQKIQRKLRGKSQQESNHYIQRRSRSYNRNSRHSDRYGHSKENSADIFNSYKTPKSRYHSYGDNNRFDYGRRDRRTDNAKDKSLQYTSRHRSRDSRIRYNDNKQYSHEKRNNHYENEMTVFKNSEHDTGLNDRESNRHNHPSYMNSNHATLEFKSDASIGYHS